MKQTLERFATRASAPYHANLRAFARLSARLVVTVIGMMGLRLDRLRGRSGALWVSLWLTAAAAYVTLFDPWRLFEARWAGRSHAYGYVVLAFAAYYGGLVWMVGRGAGAALTRRLGARRSNRIFEVGVGMAFAHQALATAAVCSVEEGTLGPLVPVWLSAALGVLLFVFGMGVKIWSALTLGLDGYYYRDMYTRQRPRATGGQLVRRGPYRWFANPMYGVGNLAGYGTALWSRSLAGLVVAAAAQALIYAFYYRYELPFLRSVYGSEPARPTTRPRRQRSRTASE